MGCTRYVQTCAEKGTVLLRTSLAWPAVAGCSRAETFFQLSAISFAQPCIIRPKSAVHIQPSLITSISITENDCRKGQTPAQYINSVCLFGLQPNNNSDVDDSLGLG